MDLPKTEKELRIAAAAAMRGFVETLDEDAQKAILIPIYSLYDIKAAGIWIARQAIRQFCPHLADTGDLDLSEEFAEGGDTPL